jgi:hypothetical protein
MKQGPDKTLLMWLVAPVVVLAGIPLYLVWAGADEDSPVWKEGVSNLHSASELTLLTPMQPDAGDLKSFRFALHQNARFCKALKLKWLFQTRCCTVVHETVRHYDTNSHQNSHRSIRLFTRPASFNAGARGARVLRRHPNVGATSPCRIRLALHDPVRSDLAPPA